MSKSAGFSVVFPIILLALILTAAALVLQPKSTPRIMDTKSNETAPTPELDVTIPETHTCTGKYTNDKYRFSINCPNNWTLTMYEKGREYKKDGTNLLDENDLAYFKFISEDATLGFDIAISDTKQNSSSTPDETGGNSSGAPSSVKQLPDTVVAGIPSQTFSSTGPGSVVITIVTKTDEVIYRFIMDDNYWDEREKAVADEVYTNLLTSFTLL